jgi:hypothetical protein
VFLLDGNHMIDYGILYSVGKGNRGQLGQSDLMTRLVPHKIEIPMSSSLREKKISQVACGFLHTLLLTESGNFHELLQYLCFSRRGICMWSWRSRTARFGHQTGQSNLLQD